MLMKRHHFQKLVQQGDTIFGIKKYQTDKLLVKVQEHFLPILTSFFKLNVQIVFLMN